MAERWVSKVHWAAAEGDRLARLSTSVKEPFFCKLSFSRVDIELGSGLELSLVLALGLASSALVIVCFRLFFNYSV